MAGSFHGVDDGVTNGPSVTESEKRIFPAGPGVVPIVVLVAVAVWVAGGHWGCQPMGVAASCSFAILTALLSGTIEIGARVFFV
jgi:hypothetical protein